jgi:hypothetical protein
MQRWEYSWCRIQWVEDSGNHGHFYMLWFKRPVG